MPPSELEICSLHFVVPEHKRDQFSLLRVSCIEELSHRAGWGDSEVSVLLFQEQICCFASSMRQSTLKEGKDFQWLLYSLCHMLHPQLLSIRAHGNPDLQLSVRNRLWVVEVFLCCLFVQNLTCWGPGFGWGLLRSNKIQMMSRSSDLPSCYNTCEIAGPNWELWHSCLKLWQTKSEAFPSLIHLSFPSFLFPFEYFWWNKLLPHSTIFNVGFQTHCSLFQEEHFTWGPYSKWIYLIRQIVSTLACKANKKKCCSANYPCKCSLKS